MDYTERWQSEGRLCVCLQMSFCCLNSGHVDGTTNSHKLNCTLKCVRGPEGSPPGDDNLTELKLLCGTFFVSIVIGDVGATRWWCDASAAMDTLINGRDTPRGELQVRREKEGERE